MNKQKYTCKKCGSTAVEVKIWVNPNNSVNNIVFEEEDTYCHQCIAGGYGVNKEK